MCRTPGAPSRYGALPSGRSSAGPAEVLPELRGTARIRECPATRSAAAPVPTPERAPAVLGGLQAMEQVLRGRPLLRVPLEAVVDDVRHSLQCSEA